MKDVITKWFKENYSELYATMKDTSHNHSNGTINPYHSEGSVWKHTEMVLDLVDNDTNLIFAALLHDVGKLYTRTEKPNGRVSFKFHENISMYKSIDILRKAQQDFNIDPVFILRLIAWHGTLWVKRRDIKEKLKTIDYCYGHDITFFKYLINLTRSDAFGRIVQDDEETINLMYQFEFLENYIPYDRLKYQEEKPLEVIFMIGISGSGKSTWIQKNNNKNYKIISVDNFLNKGKLDYNSVDYSKQIKKAHDNSIRDLLYAVDHNENAIVDMTNLDKETRRKKLSKFPSSKYLKKCIVFLNGEKQIQKNLQKRKNENGKKISNEIIQKQMISFELPNFDEFDVIEYIF